MKESHQTLPPTGSPQCPRWHRIALGVGWTGNVVLVGAVIALGVWGSGSPNSPESFDGSLAAGTTGTKDSFGVEDLKLFLCEAPASSSSAPDLLTTKTLPGSSGCRLCPRSWVQHGNKCYWVSKDRRTWNKSQEACVTKRARLLVLRDLEEMTFIKNITEGSELTWLGLTVTFPEGNWTWLDGSPLDRKTFQISGPANQNSCGIMKGSQVNSLVCSVTTNWICEKETLLL
uniref:C-type lectin domain-containing protein n=1 Tax=Sphenodon punctatus TaxID=8508 RepID=A0A8D0GKJ4_SPHPU